MTHIRHFFLLTTILLLSLHSYGQNSFLTDKITCKLGISSMNALSTSDFDGGVYFHKTKKPHYQVALNYQVNRFVDIGLSFGYSTLFHEIKLPYDEEKGHYVLKSDDSSQYVFNFYPYYQYDSHAFLYQLNSVIHLIPIFLKKPNNRFDVYLTPSIGLVTDRYKDVNNDVIKKPNFFSYGIGIGTHYLFTKHIGIFGEYHLGHFYNLSNSQWKAGLIFKF